MVTITGRYLGGLRCELTHGPSGTSMITDAPVDNEGQGRAFSPTDLVATSLGACVMTTMGIWAKRHGIDLTSGSWTATKEMSASPPRRIARLTVHMQMPATLTDDQRVRLEAVANACPVHHALHPDIVCEITFEYL